VIHFLKTKIPIDLDSVSFTNNKILITREEIKSHPTVIPKKCMIQAKVHRTMAILVKIASNK
jgi:hypothetical protein